MNDLMGIEKDIDLARYMGATKEEVEQYEEGSGPNPVVHPMRLYLEVNGGVAWNGELSELFLAHYVKELALEVDEDQKLEVLELFEERVFRIARKWREIRKKGVDKVVQEMRARRSPDRANARRNGVSLLHPNNRIFRSEISSSSRSSLTEY